MKLAELLESDTDKPFVIGVMQKLLDKGEPLYVLRFMSGGEEASRVLNIHYTYSTANIGGGLHMDVLAQGDDGKPYKRSLDLVHSVGKKGAAEFDERWTISTVKGKKVFHLRDKKQIIDNLKDDIYFVDAVK